MRQRWYVFVNLRVTQAGMLSDVLGGQVAYCDRQRCATSPFLFRARTAEAARQRVEAALAEHRHLNVSGGANSQNGGGVGSSDGSSGTARGGSSGSAATEAAVDSSAVNALKAAMAAMDEALLQT